MHFSYVFRLSPCPFAIGTLADCTRGRIVALDRERLPHLVDLTTPEARESAAREVAGLLHGQTGALDRVGETGWRHAAANQRWVIAVGDVEAEAVLADCSASALRWKPKRTVAKVREEAPPEAFQTLAKVATTTIKALEQRYALTGREWRLWDTSPTRYVIATDGSVCNPNPPPAAGPRSYFRRRGPVAAPNPDCLGRELEAVCEALARPNADQMLVWTVTPGEGTLSVCTDRLLGRSNRLLALIVCAIDNRLH